ncbi:Clr5 domain-containing protein [Amylocarpus encephaloides]|uniref:Clr5 domain-containing protein n=1 Tax=Amylocarpus encephaloides TaxID=45428 RepID=A0A9P8CAD6_9HELO|nr:Clr5 domain-containing protein [Amylocarpus encephaloides]
MPKPWSLHKAEISRLYIQEGKTLNEVRETLSRCHGFQASVRAYRMRINEWALQKYKPRDEALDEEGDFKMQNPANSGLGRANLSEELSNYGITKTDQVLKFGPSLTIPAKPSQASEVLALVQDPSAAPYALEILLIKWQPDRDYFEVLRGLLRTQQYRQFISRSTQHGRPQLFEYVEEYVAQEDQLKVGKLLLEALYFVRQTPKSTEPAWIVAWAAACRCNDWDEVRTILYDGSTASSIAGPIFLKSAHVVLAEQLLRRYIKQFRVLKARNSWVDESERSEAESCRQNSMAILEEFSDTKTPLPQSTMSGSCILLPSQIPLDDQRLPRYEGHSLRDRRGLIGY